MNTEYFRQIQWQEESDFSVNVRYVNSAAESMVIYISMHEDVSYCSMIFL